MIPKIAVGWLLQYFAVVLVGNALLGWIWPAALPKYLSLLTAATFAVCAVTLHFMDATNRDPGR